MSGDDNGHDTPPQGTRIPPPDAASANLALQVAAVTAQLEACARALRDVGDIAHTVARQIEERLRELRAVTS